MKYAITWLFTQGVNPNGILNFGSLAQGVLFRTSRIHHGVYQAENEPCNSFSVSKKLQVCASPGSFIQTLPKRFYENNITKKSSVHSSFVDKRSLVNSTNSTTYSRPSDLSQDISKVHIGYAGFVWKRCLTSKRYESLLQALTMKSYRNSLERGYFNRFKKQKNPLICLHRTWKKRPIFKAYLTLYFVSQIAFFFGLERLGNILHFIIH
jgi:hypothetical protein